MLIVLSESTNWNIYIFLMSFLLKLSVVPLLAQFCKKYTAIVVAALTSHYCRILPAPFTWSERLHSPFFFSNQCLNQCWYWMNYYSGLWPWRCGDKLQEGERSYQQEGDAPQGHALVSFLVQYTVVGTVYVKSVVSYEEFIHFILIP